MSKTPAVLVRTQNRPILAKLIVQDETFYVVEVTCRGGFKYALGCRGKRGLHWLISPMTKTELWEKMKEAWDITVK